jgi:hypothetical protein
MSKKPKNKHEAPERGDRVRLRGRPNYGTLTKYNPDSDWATVEWENGGPKICHRRELERIDQA